jgi:hypothetical protein
MQFLGDESNNVNESAITPAKPRGYRQMRRYLLRYSQLAWMEDAGAVSPEITQLVEHTRHGNPIPLFCLYRCRPILLRLEPRVASKTRRESSDLGPAREDPPPGIRSHRFSQRHVGLREQLLPGLRRHDSTGITRLPGGPRLSG